MPSTKTIKQRIRSVKNTAQITKAMEVVSATKMRRSQEFALKARPYAAASLALMQNLLRRIPEGIQSALLMKRDVKRSLLLVVTSDKGLAGAFNANIAKKAAQWIAEKRTNRKPYALITVGKKSKDYFERREETPVKSFGGYGDYTTPAQTLGVTDAVVSGFLDGSWDEVEAVYTNFRTTLVQEAVMKKILPATPEGLEDAIRGILPESGKFSAQLLAAADTRYNYEYKFEPSPAQILDALVPQLIRIHIHHVIIESNASEHSARMVAMKSASDNATELISGLSLAYNKARQAGITRELIEVTAGKEALEI